MLAKETEEQLKVLGFDVSKLVAVVKADDEQSLEVPKLFTEKQKNDFGTNRYEDAKPVMEEIIAKNLKKIFGIEIDTKDVNEVVKAYGEKITKSVGKPNEQLEKITSENTDLRTKLQDALNQNQETESRYKGELFGVQVKTKLQGLIPENTKIPKEDITTLFLNNYSVVNDETGRTVVKKGDEILKDSVLNPLPLESVFGSFLDERNYIDKSGMGGSDRTGGSSSKFKNMAEFMDYCDKNQVEPLGKEGQAMLASNKDVDFKY